MPSCSRTTLFFITPLLILLLVDPALAQNRGMRGNSSAVRGTSTRSAPRVSAPRSAPRSYSAPRSSGRSYSAPRSSGRSYSAPRSTNSPRSYSPARNTSTARAYSAPRNTASSTAPRVNAYRPNNTAALTRSNNRAYRSAVAQPNAGSSVRVSGFAPRANYPGRINNTAARVTNPQTASGSTGMASATVRGNAPTSTTAVPGRVNNGPTAGFTRNLNNVVTLPNGQTATTAVPGRTVNAAPTNPVSFTDGRVTGVSPGRGVAVARPVTQPVYNNGPVYNNTYVVRENCAPRYYNDCYDSYFYSDYNCRRGYRYFQPCYYPFLSFGFFAARPYYYYDYASISYAQPFVYGDDTDYRPAPVITDNQVASTQPVSPPSMEQEMLTELSNYVERHSVNGRFQLADPAFGNQMWNLDLTQAPAVYSIDTNHYSVVAGFEGTLGENSIPSSVGLEFFVARENGRWAIKDAWIVSANGIPRAKKFQSPSFPQVQTWQAGTVCPFSGQPMVPISASGAQQG